MRTSDGQNLPAMADIRGKYPPLQKRRISALAGQMEPHFRAPPPPISASGYPLADQICYKHAYSNSHKVNE